MICSLQLMEELFTTEENNKVIYRLFKDSALQLDALKPEPEKTENVIGKLKGYQDIQSIV